MSAISLAFAVVGLFLAAYALVLLLGRSAEDARGRRASLGCGFVLLSGLVWGIALGSYLGDRWAGFRLGFAMALLLPAVATLLHPGRGRTLPAAIALAVAVLLGVSALPRVWDRLRPSRPTVTAESIRETVEDLERRIAETDEYIDQLRDEREELRERLAERGHTEFSEIARDPGGYAMLEELAELDRLIRQSEQWFNTAGQNLEQLRAAGRRIERLARGESATGMEVNQAELDRIVREARSPPPTRPETVEEHVEREQLRRLFESEF